MTDAIDIRKPVGIEMEFDVLEPGWPFAASYDFYNEEGLLLFGSMETDPEWRNKPRMPGRYATTAWVPGNLLSEGTVVVSVELVTTHPLTRHFQERQAVAFHVVDSMDGDSARGDWGGEWAGAVRPLLDWSTRHEAAASGDRTPVRAKLESLFERGDSGRGPGLSGRRLCGGADRQHGIRIFRYHGVIEKRGDPLLEREPAPPRRLPGQMAYLRRFHVLGLDELIEALERPDRASRSAPRS